MSIVTRTNRATNPGVAVALTNYSVFGGTSGAATGTWQSGPGWEGQAGFFRSTWTAASTVISGGGVYLEPSGIAASTQYTQSIYVRPSRDQVMRLSAQYRDASNVNIGGTTFGSNTTCPANQWTRISVTATSPAGAVAKVALTAGATTGGALWQIGDTCDLDGCLIETGAVLLPYLEGGYSDGLGVDYGWNGTPNASTSWSITYTPTLALVWKSDAPCDRVEVTITDLHPSTQTVTLWRTADGERTAVRSYENVEIVGADFTTDFEVPLNRPVNYDLEVLTGMGVDGPTATETITIDSPHGWIQDPLDPTSAVPLWGDYTTDGAFLDESAIKSLTLQADVNLVTILGSRMPVALMSQRMAQSGISFAMVTDAYGMAQALRGLLEQTALVLVRPLPEWSAALPGLCYTAPPTPTEMPKTEAWGGSLIEWKFDTGLVAAPKMDVVIPVWTYQDWQQLWTTYQGAATAHTGKTYLQAKRSPTGA